MRSNRSRLNTIPRLKTSVSAQPPEPVTNHTNQHYNNTVINIPTVDNTYDEMDAEEGGQREEGEDR